MITLRSRWNGIWLSVILLRSKICWTTRPNHYRGPGGGGGYRSIEPGGGGGGYRGIEPGGGYRGIEPGGGYRGIKPGGGGGGYRGIKPGGGGGGYRSIPPGGRGGAYRSIAPGGGRYPGIEPGGGDPLITTPGPMFGFFGFGLAPWGGTIGSKTAGAHPL